MLLSSLVLSLLTSAGATGEASLASVDVGVSAGNWTEQDTSAWDVAGGFAATFFPARAVIDDDTPPSLQPFRQRLTSLSLSATVDRSQTSNGVSMLTGGASLSVSGYVAGRVWLLADLDVSHSSFGGEDTYTTVAPTFGIGARLKRILIDLQYRYVTTRAGDGSWSSHPDWGRLSLGVRAVGGDVLDFWARARTLDGGVGLGLGASLFPTRAFSLSASLEYQRARLFVNRTTDYERVLGGLGLRLWVAARTSLALAYAASWLNPGDRVGHEVALSLLVRLPSPWPRPEATEDLDDAPGPDWKPSPTRRTPTERMGHGPE